MYMYWGQTEKKKKKGKDGRTGSRELINYYNQSFHAPDKVRGERVERRENLAVLLYPLNLFCSIGERGGRITPRARSLSFHLYERRRGKGGG